jgi:DNA mismatch repair protein MutL
VVIRSIPSILGKTISVLAAKDVVDIFKDYATEIRAEIDLKDMSFIKDIVSLFACRRSIKAGDRINLHQAESLIIQLLKQKDPYTCPHGRPTLIILNAKYLEELFLRDYK